MPITLRNGKTLSDQQAADALLDLAGAGADGMPRKLPSRSTSPERSLNSQNGIAKMLMNVLALSSVVEGDVTVVRGGDKIILPDDMAFSEAHKWLDRAEKALEEPVSISYPVACFPIDGLLALQKAFKQMFGFTDLLGLTGFFGVNPPSMEKIETGFGQFEQVIMSRMAPPLWEDGYLEPVIKDCMSLHITGIVKRKFESSVKALLDLMTQFVKTESIYKGQAISVDLSFVKPIEQGKLKFNPHKHKPEFLNMTGVSKKNLILNKELMYELDISVFMRLEKQAACKANKIAFKHGCLLAGSYGTGKTTAGMVMGSIAIQNGVTFIYSKNPETMVEALKLARMYAPSIIFFEDVDGIVSGERTDQMNLILEALDGIEAKNVDVISVFTTNFVEKINPAFMRTGRVDTLLELVAPNPETASAFLHRFAVNEMGDSLLEADIDNIEIGKACNGMNASSIMETMQAAKCRCISREGADITGKITSLDIVEAAAFKTRHLERTLDKPRTSIGAKITEAAGILGWAMANDGKVMAENDWSDKLLNGDADDNGDETATDDDGY